MPPAFAFVLAFSVVNIIRESPPSSFSMTGEGPVLIYNPYEIAPYSEGIIAVVLPFTALGG